MNSEPTPARMTLDEFLERLRQTPRDWRLVAECIRTICPESSLCCPWAFVAHSLSSTQDWHVYENDEQISGKVWDAADNKLGHDPALRAKLLDACGLSDAGGGSR